MKPVIDILEERISKAMAAAVGRDDCAAIVRLSADPKFGDYQANGVMALAKKTKTNPRKLAEDVVKNLDVDDICEPPEVAGPGFINLRLKAELLADRLLEINKASANLGIEKKAEPKTIVVDFSCPNIAKQMHVGHLRSTIIGDCICRTLEFLGHNVIRQNHIGDWGTQFGMLMALLDEKSRETEQHTGVPLTVDELRVPLVVFENFYRQAKERYDSDEEFAKESRAAVALLHQDDPKYTRLWLTIVGESMKHFKNVYTALGVDLTDKHTRGESFYKDKLGDVVGELKANEFAVESDGAVCVFPEGFKNKEGQPLPFMIQKSDGAYLYATTDLAAIRYRINELKADKIIYVTDARQKLHFEMLFAVAKMAEWVSKDIELSHVMFGSVLGEDGTPLKTRSGENVKLKELLDEAVERAKAVVEEKNPDLDENKKAQIARAVGIGAVKYADYSNNRTSDYIFSFDKMLAMDGNTAPYMQYAYARIKSIERKAQTKDVDIADELAGLESLSLTEPAELDLAKYLIRYGEAIQAAAADYRPNYLTAYLYELAQKFSVFYTNCPVLKAEPVKRPTRLLLCDLTARTIKHGLSELLGIEVVEQM
ncbi:MAG: arginine--tRNA ligase [Planctomycetota bacterium]|jgi:arginyl-tRNA synthetase